MATGKLPLLLQVNSACREHLGNIAKQQFALWQPRLCPQRHGEAQQASLNGVDFARLWRTSEAGEWTFDIVFDVQRRRSSMRDSMATGKVQRSSLVRGLNSALKEHPSDFGKQQFTLWKLRLSSQHHGEGRQAPVNGVDSGGLWRTLEAGEWTF